MIYFVFLVVGVSFGLALTAIVAAVFQSKAIQHALDGIARQPEAAGSIQTAMVIGLALIESLVIYTLVISFLLMGRLPPTPEILKMIKP